MAEWVRELAWAGDRTVSRPGSNPAAATSLRNFGSSVYPALPVFTHQFTHQHPLVCPLDLGAPAGLYDGSREPTLAYKEPPVLP